jgi:quercetin dioxygenase-like cupin family protein
LCLIEILRVHRDDADVIGERPYHVDLTRSIKLAEGHGEAHAYLLYFDAGGVIGAHEAGFGQMFVAVKGSGWVAGGDGERISLNEGEAALISRGEMHSKGSDTGMTALMVQVRDLARFGSTRPR